MNEAKTIPASPMGLIRSGLLTADLAAVLLLGSAFLTVLALALASLAIAAGGLNFVLGLHYLDYFPVFPGAARIVCGMSLLAFAVFLVLSTLLLWSLFRSIWRRYWIWHHSAWSGVFVRPEAVPSAPDSKERRSALIRGVKVSAVVFLVLTAVSCALMFYIARGPFWHVWNWFV